MSGTEERCARIEAHLRRRGFSDVVVRLQRTIDPAIAPVPFWVAWVEASTSCGEDTYAVDYGGHDTPEGALDMLIAREGVP